MTQIIPDTVLALIAQHRPQLTALVASIRAQLDHVPELEVHRATEYLRDKTLLPAQEIEYLTMVAYGEPWGGTWERATLVAARLGVTYDAIRQRIEAGELEALERNEKWYIRRHAV